MKKLKKARAMRKNRRVKRIERFAEEQLERYLELHKKHEKDLNYIG